MIKMNKYFNSNVPSKILRIHRYALLKQIIYFKPNLPMATLSTFVQDNAKNERLLKKFQSIIMLNLSLEELKPIAKGQRH